MSAIAGILQGDGRPADPALLGRMAQALAHRGPDGEGQWVAGPIGLAHRLLSTTPESLNEKQPVADEEGARWLVWDGRLDNREELITALEADGNPTDPELVLAAHRRWGPSFLPRLVGDFALALWDGRTRTLVCARDPIGVKPFYYRWAGQRLCFASEVKALFADPAVVKEPDEETIADYLLMGFRDPEATFFAGIRQLPPAHVLCLTTSGISIRRYWEIDPSRVIRYAREEDYLEEFCELFREAVRCRLRSSTPVGLLLSGGIDSTAVAAMAGAILRDGERVQVLPAFTLLAEGFLREEWDAVQRLVETYETEVHPVRPDAQGSPRPFFELFLESVETPHHDTFFTVPELLEPAAGRGCRALLTGFGADELSLRAEEGFLADLLHAGRLPSLARNARLCAAAYGGDWTGTLLTLLWDQLPPRFRRLLKTLLGRQVPRWIEPAFARTVELSRWMLPRVKGRFPTFCQEATYHALTRPEMPLALEQMDGMVSRFSLECRHPYLDRRLIEFFLAMPPAVKLGAGYRKQLFQRAMAGIVPGPVRGREEPEYLLPASDYQILPRLEAERIARTLFRPRARLFRYVKRSEAERLLERFAGAPAKYRNLLWSFVRLEIWLRHWFPESPLGGGS